MGIWAFSDCRNYFVNIVERKFSILGQIEHNLSSEMTAVIDSMSYAGSVKFGLEFKRRFWEEDDRIFGGITWTNQPINEIYYPSHGYFQQKGVLIGYYMFGPASDELVTKTPAERIEYALAQGEKIHPQNPVAVFEMPDREDVQVFPVTFTRDKKKVIRVARPTGPRAF